MSEMRDDLPEGEPAEGYDAYGEPLGRSAGQHRAEGPSLTEEATRLFSVAQEWFQRTVGATQQNIATGSPDCAWCPVCQVISVMRGDRPELTDKLADAQMAVASLMHIATDALSSAMSTHTHGPMPSPDAPSAASTGGGPDSPPSTRPDVPGPTPHARNGSRVHKIRLDVQPSAEPHAAE